MTEVVTTKYRANDDTLFDNEIDCYNYEIEQSGLELWGYGMSKLDYLSSSHVVYAYCPTMESIEILKEICDFYSASFENITSPGLYIYDEDSERFVLMSEVIKDLEKRANDLRQIRQHILSANGEM
jgi:hypothetical protein